MRRGRTVGDYFLFLIKEGLFRMRKELWGWRGIAFLFVAGYMMLDTYLSVGTERELAFQGVGATWMVLLFPPRIGKLLFLLPFSQKERTRYLKSYAMAYLFSLVLLFLMIGGPASLITGYSFLLWIKIFVFQTFPFLIMYVGVLGCSIVAQRGIQGSGWFFSTRGWWYQDTDTAAEIRREYREVPEAYEKKKGELTEAKRRDRKKKKRFFLIVVPCAVVVSVQCFCGWMFLREGGLIFWIGAALAYVCAFISFFMCWNRTSEELKKKGSTGKEEGRCNF